MNNQPFSKCGEGLFILTSYIETPRSSYARALVEIKADVELKDTIMVAMSKLVREGFHTCTIRVEYEWKHPRCACCKVFGHGQDECPNNIDSGVAKNLKKPSQAPRGVLIRSKGDLNQPNKFIEVFLKRPMPTIA
uniref:Zinc knuckle CX2CX4HX4C n=1 Tax=Tanacetum cinerariifolium TaxID=118510 RepID=A0A699JG44_TANCI|nr:hypothetical protein [Tanacetum cinerariifolium]